MQKFSKYKINIKSTFKLFVLLCFLAFSQVNFAQNASKFKVVLDAGHGGQDPGNKHHGFIEKSIALSVTLKVGELLKKEQNFDLLFTRSTDVFIELVDRPKIANEANADLFVSIHCNAAANFSAYGTETFVMGLTRSKTNLEVAKNENSVILLEKDYKEKYNGFDPSKPESLTTLKILQEEYLNQSISLASKVQDNFTNDLKRRNRNVKQAPLWVLDASYMPGVLIEIGFLSNKEEGAYLNTEDGQNEIAKAIAQAIIDYKKENFYVQSSSTSQSQTAQIKKTETIEVKKVEETVVVKSINTSSKTDVVEFKVQLAASKTKLNTIPANFKGLKNISMETEKGLYKYFYESESTYKSAQKRLEEAKDKGYTSAYIVAYKDGIKISLSDAIK